MPLDGICLERIAMNKDSDHVGRGLCCIWVEH
jgi:hypothetical protein